MASVHGDEIQTDTSDISTKSKAVRYDIVIFYMETFYSQNSSF